MDHLKRSLMTKNLNRFDILNHFGVGAALAPIHGGFLACGGVKNQLGKVCINLEFISVVDVINVFLGEFWKI